jgi:hypothetical protein
MADLLLDAAASASSHAATEESGTASTEKPAKRCKVLRVPTIHLFQRVEFRPKKLDHLPLVEMDKFPKELVHQFVLGFNAHEWAREHKRWSVAVYCGVVHLVGIDEALRPCQPSGAPFVMESNLSMEDALLLARTENRAILEHAHVPRVWCLAVATPELADA